MNRTEPTNTTIYNETYETILHTIAKGPPTLGNKWQALKIASTLNREGLLRHPVACAVEAGQS